VSLTERRAEFVYEAARLAAIGAGAPIVPVPWDEREQVYKCFGKIIKTSNITQSAEGHKDGLWTTTVASAVLIFE